MERLPRANTHFPRKQAHIDLHLPATLRPILQEYSPEAFAQMLDDAGVELVGLFAKGHYGNAYYPSRVGTPHPGMACDYLGETTAACKARGITVLAYISISRDHDAGERHPEWCTVDATGAPVIEWECWHSVCISTGYVDYCTDMAHEILDHCDVDGLWLDGTTVRPSCFCESCRTVYRTRTGRDLTQAEKATRDYGLFRAQQEAAFVRVLSEAVVPHRQAAWLGPVRSYVLPYVTPVGGINWFAENEVWPKPGDHRDTFAPMLLGLSNRRLGIPYQAMTVLARNGWGEYTLKDSAQLHYETALSACQGASVSVGINLDPSGRLHRETAEAYRDVFHWLAPRLPCSGDDGKAQPLGIHTNACAGAATIALSTHLAFDIEPECVVARDGPEAHRAWVLPTLPDLPSSWAERVLPWLEGGGRLLISGEIPCIDGVPLLERLDLVEAGSAQEQSQTSFCYAAFGPSEPFARELPYLLPGTHFTMRAKQATESGRLVLPLDGGDGRATIAQISSPPGRETKHAALYRWQVGRGLVTYAPYRLFIGYWEHGHDHLYDVGKALLEDLAGDLMPFRISDAYPLTSYGAWRGDRYFIHLVNEPMRRPIRRSAPPPAAKTFAVLRDVEVALRIPDARAALLHPEGVRLPLRKDGVVVIPSLEDYAIVEVRTGANRDEEKPRAHIGEKL